MKPIIKGRKRNEETRASLRELHNRKLDEFEHKSKELPKLKEKLIGLQNQKHPRQKEIKSVQQQIKHLENESDMSEYLLDIFDVLKQKAVPNNTDTTNDTTTSSSPTSSSPTANDTTNTNKITYSQYNKMINTSGKLYRRHKKSAGSNSIDRSADRGLQSTPIDNFVKVKKKKFNKELLVNDYLKATGELFDTEHFAAEDKDIFECEECNSELVQNRHASELICQQCGLVKEWQDPLDSCRWNTECYTATAYRYKRYVYFHEHLSHFQAKENTVIPKHVINKISLELRKRRIYDANQITYKLMRKLLKEAQLTDYYENINNIIRQLSGKKAPEFTEELEERLKSMFTLTLAPFEKWKHLIPGRNNYLSYPYVIRKLLMIISQVDQDPTIKEFVNCFNLLKSREKLYAQEKVWEKICEETGFPFIRSI
jgi:predicted RNA-binding Zn-ribbon protein involved in translation (DUF1610 family)